jgi:hypothetical protein
VPTKEGNDEVTVTESKDLKIGTRVCWGGNTSDAGRITNTSWDSVTIAWDNDHLATIYRGDMRDIRKVK